MSKAFTKEDDEAGFSAPPPTSPALPSGAIRLTTTGARILTTRLNTTEDSTIRSALARAQILPCVTDPARAALGVTVLVRDQTNTLHRYRLVTPEENLLLGEGCSISSPIGRSVLGAKVGDVCEVFVPRHTRSEEFEVLGLEGEQLHDR